MRILWASEINRDYNACRLFFTKKSAIKAITKDMESIGFSPNKPAIHNKRSITIQFFNPKEPNVIYLWHFYHLMMG